MGRSFLAVIALLLVSTGVLAAESKIYTPLFGKAVSGYDPVAYFKQGAPVKGSGDYALEYQGATWHFSSAENRAAFEADPERYAPQFGGYCAYGVSQGALVSTDPEYWAIVDGKLYLNYSKEVQELWNKDIPGFIEKANSSWPSVSGVGGKSN